VTAGAVSRTFPIPGIAENAIGLKTIEEAVASATASSRTSTARRTSPPVPSATAF
jgi:NADH dehydrogenase